MKLTKDITAFITGGGSGLGYATAEAVIADGGKVCIVDINEANGQDACKKLGDRAIFIATDVTNEQQVDNAVTAAVKKFAAINLAVNCAGIAPSQRVLAKDGLMSTTDFSKAISINLISTFCVCRSIANVMQHNKETTDGERGVVVNTASIAAYDGQIGQAAYAASKGGIVSMTLPLAREFARIGIRVMTIAPGLFKTPMFDKLPEKAITALTENIPFPKRPGDPQEFANLVLHIYQNSNLNGETIRLDGALRM